MSEGHWNEEGYWVFGSNLEAVEPNPKPSLVIKLNNAATNDPCTVCGQRTDPETGPELFLEGTWALVCYECGGRHAPVLMQLLHDYRASDEFAEFLGDAPYSKGRILDEDDATPF